MSTPTSSIQVIDRMASLMNILAVHDQPLSLKIISKESQLHPSTTFRILGALCQHRFVEREKNGSYKLGSRLLQLGGKVRSHIVLRDEALPIMQWLQNKIGETINLSIREDTEIVYIERVSSYQTVRAEQIIGSRAPLHITAVGKMMLGDEGEAGCREYAELTKLPEYTSNTIVEVDELIRAATKAIESGYALDNEEAENGVGCVGVLVRDSRGVAVAGLSVSSPIERLREDWAPMVMEAARRLSGRLGHLEIESHKHH